jgi:hypothetical protein
MQKLILFLSLLALIGGLRAQSKVYTTNEFGSNKKQIGLLEGGASLAEMVVILSRFSLF